MPFQLLQGDITTMEADAIVNAANPTLLGGGGVDGAIHQAAGPDLLRECKGLGGCKTGRAKVTGAYRLKATYVIHTVGPIYRDGKQGEEKLLRSCYRSCLQAAVDKGATRVLFPLISAGVYGYPKKEAFLVAVSEIEGFLKENPSEEVGLVLYRQEDFEQARHWKEAAE